MALQLYEHQGAAPPTGLSAPIGSTDLSFSVNAGTGYPTGAGGLFVVCLDAGTALEEKILCSARVTNAFTVQTGGRGFDGTTAQAHSAGSANVTHVWTAAEASDTSAHIYTTTRDDHTQYARTDGSRAVTGLQTFDTGIVVAASGAAVTGNSTVTGTLGVSAALTGSSTVTGTALIPTGLTGAVAATRFVGGTASGAPASGTFAKGDFVIDQTGVVWICSTAGSPGTWTRPSAVSAVGAALSGGSPAAPFSIQAATSSGTTNGSAEVTTNFPVAFANGAVSVVISNFAGSAQNSSIQVISATAAHFVAAFSVNGSPFTGSPVNFTWMAVGW